MSRIDAALDDLARLAADIRALGDDVRPTELALRAAIDLAWATSATFLGGRSGVDDALAAHLHAADGTAAAIDAAARRLRIAGGDGTFLDVVPFGRSSAAGRLAATSAALGAVRLGGQLWPWLRRAFIRPAGPAPYVVSSRVQTYGVSAWVDASLIHQRDELSDGSVRITELRSGSVATGVGLGASCSLEPDGAVPSGAARSVAAEIGLGGAASRTWVFGSPAQADAWWADHEDELLVEALARTTPLAGPTLDAARALRQRITGDDEELRPDEEYREVTATGAVEALFSQVGGTAVAALAGNATVRRNGDGTSTVIVHDTVAATAALGLGQEPGRGPGATVQGDLAAELTVSDSGHLDAVVLRAVTVDRPGLTPDLDHVLGGLSTVATVDGIDALHVYETTMTLDLGDAETRDRLGQHLAVDVAIPGGALQAALAAITFDPRAVLEADVTVLERTPLEDGRWRAGCDVELPVLNGGVGVSGGTTTQQTVAAWRKDAGATELQPLR